MKLVTIAIAACIASAVAHGCGPEPKLTVYWNLGATDRLTIALRAQAMTVKTFAKIGVCLDWKSGRNGMESSRDAIVMNAIDVPATTLPGALAYARPYGDGQITIFFDRVERLENPAIVLAHVMVHELTHVAQALDRHAPSGVMKAHWTGSDYGEMRRNPLPFTPLDVDLIHQGLAKRPSVTMLAAASPPQ